MFNTQKITDCLYLFEQYREESLGNVLSADKNKLYKQVLSSLTQTGLSQVKTEKET